MASPFQYLKLRSKLPVTRSPFEGLISTSRNVFVWPFRRWTRRCVATSQTHTLWSWLVQYTYELLGDQTTLHWVYLRTHISDDHMEGSHGYRTNRWLHRKSYEADGHCWSQTWWFGSCQWQRVKTVFWMLLPYNIKHTLKLRIDQPVHRWRGQGPCT